MKILGIYTISMIVMLISLVVRVVLAIKTHEIKAILLEKIWGTQKDSFDRANWAYDVFLGRDEINQTFTGRTFKKIETHIENLPDRQCINGN